MKTILTTLIVISILSLNAQETISDIKSNSQKIKGRMSNSFYRQDTQQLKELKSILNLDVFEYFDLKTQYDTDLKKKVYKSSEDYQTKYSKLKELKSKIIATTYFLDYEPTYYERNNLINYDLKTKTFTTTNEIYYRLNYNKLGYVQFDHITFKCPIGITIKKKNANYGGVDFIIEKISFKIEDENLALKIEENRSNLRFLFVFNFTETKKFQDNVLGLTTRANYHLITNIKKVIIYNSKTDEIYFTY